MLDNGPARRGKFWATVLRLCFRLGWRRLSQPNDIPVWVIIKRTNLELSTWTNEIRVILNRDTNTETEVEVAVIVEVKITPQYYRAGRSLLMSAFAMYAMALTWLAVEHSRTTSSTNLASTVPAQFRYLGNGQIHLWP